MVDFISGSTILFSDKNIKCWGSSLLSIYCTFPQFIYFTVRPILPTLSNSNSQRYNGGLNGKNSEIGTYILLKQMWVAQLLPQKILVWLLSTPAPSFFSAPALRFSMTMYFSNVYLPPKYFWG